MTEIANTLMLEHVEGSIRLDRKKLTIIADTIDGPIPLSQIGSGANWIGYHVAAHLGLHRMFRARQRPVPAFLVLDQPSQAHYPADVEQAPPPKDEDRDRRPPPLRYTLQVQRGPRRPLPDHRRPPRRHQGTLVSGCGRRTLA